MPVSKAQQKAVAKYEAKAYDKTLIRLPKGQLDGIKSHAAARGESVNGFIGRAITETMERDDGGGTPANAPESPTEGVSASGGILTPAALETATEAAQRDGASLRMGIHPAAGPAETANSR